MATRQDPHSFYISSPLSGLEKERELAKQLITRQGHAYRDSYMGSTHPLVETCQADVRSNDHYILILGLRYGTRLAEYGGKSVTELEFEEALKVGRPVHAFFIRYCDEEEAGIDFDPDAREALMAFRARVTDRCKGGCPWSAEVSPMAVMDGRCSARPSPPSPPTRPHAQAPSLPPAPLPPAITPPPNSTDGWRRIRSRWRRRLPVCLWCRTARCMCRWRCACNRRVPQARRGRGCCSRRIWRRCSAPAPTMCCCSAAMVW